jgi:hypothetical protein
MFEDVIEYNDNQDEDDVDVKYINTTSRVKSMELVEKYFFVEVYNKNHISIKNKLTNEKFIYEIIEMELK